MDLADWSVVGICASNNSVGLDTTLQAVRGVLLKMYIIRTETISA